MFNKYNPQDWWDRVGKRSVSGDKDNAKFDIDEYGGSLYDIPSIDGIPKFYDYIENDSNVLDIGSGIGYYVINLAKRGINANGCDISDSLLNIARDNCRLYNISSSERFFKWDGHRLPFNDNSYNIVTTNTVLQHVISESQIQDIFNEVSRVLNKDGYFCISELISPKEFRSSVHVKQRTMSSYISIAEKNGFQAIDIIYFPQLYGSFFYLYTKLFKNSTLIDSKSNKQNNKEFPSKGKKNNSVLKILNQMVKFITRYLLDPIIGFFKLGKYFHSQANIVFKLVK